MTQIPSEITIHQNAAECIKSVRNIGHTAYHNICSNTRVDVPWGSGDWTLAAFLALFLLGMIGFVAYVVWDSSGF